MNSQLHNALKSLAWLQGIWRTEKPASGQYPTIKSFEYCEELDFSSIGQPMLNYTAQSWNPDTKRPMHREVGFLKIIPDTDKVTLFLSHNFGLCTVEEGCVGDNEITLNSTNISRKTDHTKSPMVQQIKREFKLMGDELHQILYMATENTDLTQHLHAVYKRQKGSEQMK